MKRLTLLLLLIVCLPLTAKADFKTDLQTLVVDARTLETELKATNVAIDSLCGPLLQINQSARDLINQITLVDESLAAPLQLDSDILDAMDELTEVTLSLANEALRLSLDINVLSASINALTLKDGITAMLQLSDDIGTMADRIGEMSDKILIMSDNIGLMADRILVSQELQSQNIEQTSQFVLQTQNNALTLVSVVEDSTYEFDFNKIIIDGGLLAIRMDTTILTSFNMDRELSDVALDVNTFLQVIKQTSELIATDAANNNMMQTYEALIQLSDMSLMLTSLATAVDGYVIAISGLQAITYKPRLSDSLQSMLQLSGDIGLMANRILEMADQILLMSDNIGMQADQILLTQAAMNANVQTTQTALLAAQEMVIGIIDLRNL